MPMDDSIFTYACPRMFYSFATIIGGNEVTETKEQFMPYLSSRSHILAELQRITLLIRLQIERFRQHREVHDEFRGLFISDKQAALLVERLAGSNGSDSLGSDNEFDLRLNEIDEVISKQKADTLEQGVVLRLEEFCVSFSLTSLERDILLVGLASELNLEYGTIFAYLQDDITRKRPTVELALQLLSHVYGDRYAIRACFGADAPLIANHLIKLETDPAHPHPPLLGRSIRVFDRIVEHLLGSESVEPELAVYMQLESPSIRLQDIYLSPNLGQVLVEMERNPVMATQSVFYLQGGYGVGKQSIAEGLCRVFNKKLLVVSGSLLLMLKDRAFSETLALIFREAILLKTAIFWQGFDGFIVEEKAFQLKVLLKEIEKAGFPVFLAGDKIWEPKDSLYEKRFIRLEVPRPSFAERKSLWEKEVGDDIALSDNVDLAELANKFRLSGGQIRDAIATARNRAASRGSKDQRITMADFYNAARLQSNRRLVTLAQKIAPRRTWDDIVLPDDLMEKMRELCNWITHRSLVYEEWGFEEKMSYGKGLNVLFSGRSGTGKTLAAEIMAGHLNLELYKIDLSSLVSKYIGETEKNLARIFAEAEASNVILFFDEADAIFGKRSEVRDAHDRYANIEVSYLLQKMEEHQGMVILATNFLKNLDDAFMRRIHFILDFPFPSEKDRLRIWQQIWPPSIPFADDVDFGHMANCFEIPGGNISNIALAAAFLAADSDHKKVTMDHLIQATRREFQKMGELMVGGDFGQ